MDLAALDPRCLSLVRWAGGMARARKLLAFRIRLNGTKLVTAGVPGPLCTPSDGCANAEAEADRQTHIGAVAPVSPSLWHPQLNTDTLGGRMNSDKHRGWKALCDRRKSLGYSALSDGDRVWLNVRWLIDSVENGGLISYFYNSAADTFADCHRALLELSAHDVLLRVECVAALFGAEVPATVVARAEVIDAWPDDVGRDQLLEQIDEELMPMMSELEDQLRTFLIRVGLPS